MNFFSFNLQINLTVAFLVECHVKIIGVCGRFSDSLSLLEYIHPTLKALV